jgi:uncharacterized coiled-coil protein SlyX
MATIGERLDALESILTDSMTLQDRIGALEKQVQTFTDALAGGEKQYQYLQTLPEGRCKEIDENTASITDALDEFNKAIQEQGEPVDVKVADLANRIKAMESAIGISG